MIYRYDGDKFIDFTKVEFMEFTERIINDDKTLELAIHMDSSKVHRIKEYEKTVQRDDGTFMKSNYPLEKLRRIANAWLKWKNNQNLVVERTITKTGNTEIIHEKLLYNSKEPDKLQPTVG